MYICSIGIDGVIIGKELNFIFEKYMKRILFVALMAVGLLSCKEEVKHTETMSGLNTKDLVSKVNGKETGLYVLKNAHGLEACITNYGGRLVSLLYRTGMEI